jgi:hypothetical protein
LTFSNAIWYRPARFQDFAMVFTVGVKSVPGSRGAKPRGAIALEEGHFQLGCPDRDPFDGGRPAFEPTYWLRPEWAISSRWDFDEFRTDLIDRFIREYSLCFPIPADTEHVLGYGEVDTPRVGQIVFLRTTFFRAKAVSRAKAVQPPFQAEQAREPFPPLRWRGRSLSE